MQNEHQHRPSSPLASLNPMRMLQSLLTPTMRHRPPTVSHTHDHEGPRRRRLYARPGGYQNTPAKATAVPNHLRTARRRMRTKMAKASRKANR